MFPRCYRGFKMHRVKVGRRCDNDGVDFFGRENFVIGLRSDEELFWIEGRKAFWLLNFVEVFPRRFELVREKIGKSNDPRGARIDKIAGIFRAAATTAKQANSHVGICGRAAD